ncbi:GNAT family N-acetyltransferase [Pseudoalteromonas piscicida]|uniref:GNAT family N-acetyltransferase n=1 Tax=Pseudoalteromonas piscicida TaxID=43662 RepID=UPI001CB72592|nr:GNAT family protein [Pseudoalteromonas piscicida]
MIVPPGEKDIPISDISVEFSDSAFALRTLRIGEYKRLERLFSLRYGDEYDAEELLKLRQQRVLVPFLQATEDKSKHCICVRQTQTREMLGMILIKFDDSAAKKVLVEESWFIHDALYDKVFCVLVTEYLNNLKLALVEFRVDKRNSIARRQLEKLGADFDGILRREGVYRNECFDLAVYSISQEEWQCVVPLYSIYKALPQ